MKFNRLHLGAALLTLFIFSSCAKDVKDAIDDATDSIECAKRVQEFDDKNDANPDRPCTDIVADINDIENVCAEFLSKSVKDEFAELRAQCEGN